MKVALLQICSSDDPAENLGMVTGQIDQAAKAGATFILTPEVTNCVSTSRTHQMQVLRPQADDPTLKALQAEAARHGIWLLIGSLALKTDDPDGRFANRSFLIDPSGRITAHYDKIHMFDVNISETEAYHESKGYRPGTSATLARTDIGTIGLTICYDLRFPHLYRDLAQAGAQIITVPSAFSPVTGAAHWEPLLRARAIETGCFILAPAQTGTHSATRGKPRKTYGHSMVIAPWGDVLSQAENGPEILYATLDLSQVEAARQKVPSLTHDRGYTAPL
ncbi:carbon-nitrogen hydrolase family protein [Litoreibacter roseus]|uniref:Amidohydrolase n=1 Tax=Litoreibacter roseus TaxID=2601869 RepID=A0A6N6JGT7_9RHOB|nr:carbon-nitrogen hydrolase family protein [Litoreibacter roseus]GFE64508.1 amidohydrolase [Litoreibacter roseus]